MKLSNFKNYKTHLKPNDLGLTGKLAEIGASYSAEVDVTTGFFFKKTETKKVFREYGRCWFFVDSGELCIEIEPLVRAYEAQQLIKE